MPGKTSGKNKEISFSFIDFLSCNVGRHIPLLWDTFILIGKNKHLIGRTRKMQDAFYKKFP